MAENVTGRLVTDGGAGSRSSSSAKWSLGAWETGIRPSPRWRHHLLGPGPAILTKLMKRIEPRPLEPSARPATHAPRALRSVRRYPGPVTRHATITGVGCRSPRVVPNTWFEPYGHVRRVDGSGPGWARRFATRDPHVGPRREASRIALATANLGRADRPDRLRGVTGNGVRRRPCSSSRSSGCPARPRRERGVRRLLTASTTRSGPARRAMPS